MIIQKSKRKRAVSELYASLMMVGVTLSFGSVVTVAAVNSFNLTSSSASAAIAVQEASAGQQISLLYGTVNGLVVNGCPTYRGADGLTYHSQTTYTLALYDYGSIPFTPNEIFDNSTMIATWSGSPTNTLAAGGATVFTIATPCARPSGQTFLLVDTYGDEVQVGT